MRKTILFTCLLLVSVWSCKKDDVETPYEGSVELRFAAVFDGQPVEIYENYLNANGHEMNFEQVRMYMSDISLVKQNGTTVKLSEIEYFNYEGDVLTRSFTVNPGDYSGIVFHVGVPTDLNGTDNEEFLTSQYGPESPLNVQNGMYWSWQAGYKFLIYEGRVDTTPDDMDDFPSVFSIHLGKDQFYSEISVDLPFTIADGETKSIDIDWDLAKNMHNTDDTLQLGLAGESTFHGSEMQFGQRFQSLLEEAFTLSVQ